MCKHIYIYTYMCVSVYEILYNKHSLNSIKVSVINWNTNVSLNIKIKKSSDLLQIFSLLSCMFTLVFL